MSLMSSSLSSLHSGSALLGLYVAADEAALKQLTEEPAQSTQRSEISLLDQLLY